MRVEPYSASEDSAILRRVVLNYEGESCLEIGSGNAGALIELSRKFDLAVGSDIVRPGVHDWARAGAEYILADRAGCFKDGSFDLVVFNPPYLQSKAVHDTAVDGGRGGAVPLAFLKEALRVVKPSGKVVFLLNEESPLGLFMAECERGGFQLDRIGGRHLFYEELSVYEATMAQGASSGGRVMSSDGSYTDTSAASRLHQVPASPS